MLRNRQKADHQEHKTPASDTPKTEVSSSESLSPSSEALRDERDALPNIDLDDLLSGMAVREDGRSQNIATPAHVVGFGSLDRLIDQARNYAEAAAAENNNKTYKADRKHFGRWYRI